MGPDAQRNLADLWCYDIPAGIADSAVLNSASSPLGWRLVEVQGVVPRPRQYHSLAHFPGTAGQLVLFGGAHCNPGSDCMGDVHVLTVDDSEGADTGGTAVAVVCEALPIEGPIPRYRQCMATGDGAVYVFGGESFKPYMYHNDIWELM